MGNVAEMGVLATSKGVRQTDRELDGLAKSADRAEVSTEQFTKATKRMNTTLAGAVGKLGAFAAAYVSIAGARQAIMSAREFNGALAEVSTLLEGTTEEMAALEKQSMRLAGTFGGNAAMQAKGFYQAISAGAGDVAEATLLLDAANKLAVGGVTDVTTGVDVLTTAMNVYKKSGLSAAEASDALFVGMRAGKTTIGELSAGIGKLLPLGSALGLSFDELVAGTSALTKGGISTAESITGMRATLAAITGPSKQATDLAKELGIEFNAAGLAATKGGLNAFMADIVKKTGGSTAAMQRLFGGVEATGVALAFAGQSGQFYGEILDDMTDKAGTTQTAFEKMAGSLEQRLNVQLAKFGNAALAIGGALLAVAVPAMEAMTGAVTFLADNSDILGAIMVTIASTQIPALVASLLALTSGISLAGGAAALATGALKLFGAAVAIAGGPLTLVVSLLAGAASYFLLFRDNAGKAEQGAYDAKDGTDALNTALGTFYQTSAPNAAAAAIDVANANVKMAKSAVDAARAEIMKQKALNQAFLAPDASGWNAPAEGFIDEIASRTEASNTRLDGLLADLQKATVERRNAANAITGSMSEVMTRKVSTPTLPVVEVEIPAGLGGGGASAIEDTFADRMEALMAGLQTEREAADAWKSESLATLMEARELEKLSQGEYNEYKLRVEQEYQDRIAGIRDEGIAGALGQTSKMFGDLNALAGGGYDGLLKAQKVFAAAEAVVNTYRAAAQVIADPTIPFFAKAAAAASIVAAGMGFVNAIKGSGPSSSSSSASSSGASGTSATTTATTTTPQRVLLDFQGQGLVSVEMLAEIIAGLQEESKNGVIIEVAA